MNVSSILWPRLESIANFELYVLIAQSAIFSEALYFIHIAKIYISARQWCMSHGINACDNERHEQHQEWKVYLIYI